MKFLIINGSYYNMKYLERISISDMVLSIFFLDRQPIHVNIVFLKTHYFWLAFENFLNSEDKILNINDLIFKHQKEINYDN